MWNIALGITFGPAVCFCMKTKVTNLFTINAAIIWKQNSCFVGAMNLLIRMLENCWWTVKYTKLDYFSSLDRLYFSIGENDFRSSFIDKINQDVRMGGIFCKSHLWWEDHLLFLCLLCTFRLDAIIYLIFSISS